MNDPDLPIDEKEKWKNAANSLVANSTGALLTFWASQDLGMGPVLSSAAVGLLGSLLLPKLSAEIFTGSFVGMCSRAAVPQFSLILFAGLIAGWIFHMSRSTLVGFGGKLGTIAFASVILTAWMAGGKPSSLAPPTADFTWAFVISSALAAALTWLLAEYKNLGAVRASSLVGLIGAFILPLLLPSAGGDHAVAVFCASFVGMASHERMPKPWMIILAGAIAGVIFQLSAPLFGGFGGKLGTIALVSVMSVWGYHNVIIEWSVANSESPGG
ncbi:MAG: hypothetical protein FJZ98_07425 [Chloroflexi bacterium]|nr:hypothetical protein [Chloroflexota bacterium]